ncbi:tyrosine-type recombinase/integrase [Crossiella sp. SN42]|uniref:tyrosine-type recombinase/integrase n=1 Tax=Crossiella sp. SN42 TaxID=2944808 RepID=UPI00207C83B1|nr:tyrosine-type recombinase/integrase [Crossiella sp. SN42]MCO1581200.1 tyrosine-type recombinase/integrase [Crossiella sp. SN42]
MRKTSVYVGERTTTYKVRWVVDGKVFTEPFKTTALAESFRSQLLSAQRQGEAFVVETGLPVSMARAEREMSWLAFAMAYNKMKWPRSAGKSRAGIAETLTAVTLGMLSTNRGKPDDKVLRRALSGWAFNLRRQQEGEPAEEIAAAFRWLERNTKPVSVLADATVLRPVADRLTLKLDGTQAASSVVRRKRAVLHNALKYGVEELKVLTRNALPEVKWKATKAVRVVDKRVVVNHGQAKRLLGEVEKQEPSGPRLKAYFALMYYAAARPAEAINLREEDLKLPAEGWGEIYLWESAPETGAAWSDSGTRRDPRGLKHREQGEVRVVLSPPELTALLWWHLKTFGVNKTGHLFYGVRSGELISEGTISRTWRKARKDGLTEREFNSPLASRPYDLRHACVSTQLNAGVDPTQVAEWAGHSVEVLLRVYAACIAGNEDRNRKRIEEALRDT